MSASQAEPDDRHRFGLIVTYGWGAGGETRWFATERERDAAVEDYPPTSGTSTAPTEHGDVVRVIDGGPRHAPTMAAAPDMAAELAAAMGLDDHDVEVTGIAAQQGANEVWLTVQVRVPVVTW